VTRSWTSGRRLDLPPHFYRGRLLGTGPAYPGVLTRLGRWHGHTVFEMPRILHPEIAVPGHWLVAKVLWMMNRPYRSPLLVRGRQVDGPHRMVFDQSGEGHPTQVRLLRNSNGASNFAVPGPGCYAWQLDGRGVRRVLIFRVVLNGRY
jgi:hypothetical protein